MWRERAKIRIEELREDAARARLAGRTRKPGGWHLGFVGGWLSHRVAGAGVSRAAGRVAPRLRRRLAEPPSRRSGVVPRGRGGGLLRMSDGIREQVRQRYAEAALSVKDEGEAGCCESSCCGGSVSEAQRVGLTDKSYSSEDLGELP